MQQKQQWRQLVRSRKIGVSSTIEKMAPAGFVSLSNFNQRKLQPREVLSVYLHELKRLLNQAIPNLDAVTPVPYWNTRENQPTIQGSW